MSAFRRSKNENEGGPGRTVPGERGLLAGGDIGLGVSGDGNEITVRDIVTGDNNSITHQYHLPAKSGPVWPHQVGVVPLPARSFQHRGEGDRLRAAVEGGGTAVLSQVLTGMGGVGKTQLAADYARAAWDGGGLDVLVWVTASARSAVVSGFAQAGVELCRADTDDPEQAAKQFLAWLAPKAGQRPCRWLIVLDDVADPNDLIVHPDDPAHRYSLWPPASPHGRVLLTTRRRDAALFGEGRRRIEVGLFTPDESLAYLTASLNAQGRTESADQLTALAHDLGHLPLALAQAAAYLIDSGETAAAYRHLLADRTTTLDHLSPDALPDEQGTALAAAWSLSIDRADTLRPAGLARPMLHLAALLDANGIPQDVLTGQSARAYLAAHRTITGPTPQQTPVSPADAVRTLRALDRLSLIDHHLDTPYQAVRVHQLIQRATRDTLTPHQHHQATRTAADALMAAWPNVERDTDLAQVLRTNADGLTHYAEDALYRPDVHPVLYRLGLSLGESGQVTAAIDHFQHLTDITGNRLGEDHPDTLTARGNLVVMRGEAGDAAGAAQAFADLLTDRIRVLGEDHPQTLITRGNLVSMLGEAGDAAGAAQAFADLLADRIRVLGKDHADTLITRGNLARWLGQAGDAAGAAQAFSGLLESMVRVLGEDHPDTLTTRNNLAAMLKEAGDAAGAAQAFADLLADRIRVLGKDHPQTLIARNNLAAMRGEAGDAAGAVQAFTDLLESMVRVLGEDHPQTLNTRHNLATVRGEAGDAAGAAQAFTDLLADRIRVQGVDHPHLPIIRRNLEHWRKEAERMPEPSGDHS
ncbi:tetratricopeptide repeat protein [Streptomyces sp. NBC_00047]|uniref:tetratricopeptide repeat protein n=1 Tax=Streptomyces sp. NBC_00047 TaxID=2975627 RepID=UPI00224F6C21|nr:tetratricopeptide repeat protein [Streptomyces sp. NBC_00047]MCX5613541.1 tetratricopeptide repeat protein [Streptomyces sp. NBC_00047]